MLCQNCGKNEANFHYTQVINGVKKEMALCEHCAKELGLESLDFNIPIDISSFLGDFLESPLDTLSLSSFSKKGLLKCEKCGMTYNEFIENGKVGCANCYELFSAGLDGLLKNIQGSSKHVGRIGKNTNNLFKNNINSETKNEQHKNEKSKEDKIEKLNIELKSAIKEERYEDAAKIRDEINDLKKTINKDIDKNNKKENN